MNDQFFEMDELENEDELLAFDHEDEAADYEFEFDAHEFGDAREQHEIELAAELLSVSDEQELDQFLSKLWRGARGILNTPAGQKLKGMLRKTASDAIPLAGQAIGGYFGGDKGAAFGGKVASAAGQLFGLELEGLSPEDRELQIARRYVRLASEALRRLASSSSGGDPMRIAQTAFIGAARRHAPGLASRMANGYGNGYGNGTRGRARARTGRWFRRGGKIVVLGL